MRALFALLRGWRSEAAAVATASLVATWLFFTEYLPPFETVHFFSDIEGYHYPLLQFVYSELRSHRFPQWDPSLYCGLPLLGNVQVGLLYPLNWVMFAWNLAGHRDHLSFVGLEGLVFFHLWIGFFLCYLWLRRRPLCLFPSLFGAAVFGFSGYMMSQLNHVGVICGMVWTPLALWGIDEVPARGWRSLWKVAAASALCFLAGFPPTWIAFCAVVTTYALFSRLHWRAAAGALLALAFSILLFMAQLLPTMSAAAQKVYEAKYGAGIKDPEFFASYFVPNYFDLAVRTYGWGDTPGVYMYLGVPALFGLAWLLRRGNVQVHAQALAVLAVSLVGVVNPFNVVGGPLVHSPLLYQMCHTFNFLEGISTAAALITAVSLHDFLCRKDRTLLRWVLPASAVLLAAWSVRLFWVWLPGGADFAARWKSAWDAAISLALFAAGLLALRAASGPRRAVMATALLLTIFVEYKVFGTSRGFSAREGNVDTRYRPGIYPGLDDAVYHRMSADRDFRVALDQGASPWAVDLRHFGLRTPQGFDPLLPEPYRKFIAAAGMSFPNGRDFYFRPTDVALMRSLGVKYFITMPDKPSWKILSASPDFRLLQPATSYFNVFELLDAQPISRWEPSGSGAIVRRNCHAGGCEFQVRAQAAGRLMFVEQCFPGWSATVDGRPAAVEHWNGAFQAVNVPGGKHSVRMVYESPGLGPGLVISFAALAALIEFARRGAAPARPVCAPDAEARSAAGAIL